MNEQEEDNLNEEEQEQELFEHFRVVVDKGQGALRIDKYLMVRVENATRTKIQKAADADSILVNNKPVKSNYKVRPLDIISVVLPNPPRNPELIAEDIPVSIVYEDDHLLIVNKAAGMVVHPGFNNYTGTLVNALLFHLQQLPAYSDEMRPGLVHRIDKDTSGLILIAKTEMAMVKLARQFYDHTVERRYLALAWGNLEEDEGTINGHLARDPLDRRRSKVFEDGLTGKHAITHWK
ncbi:MAG: RluA family pseudouridine synthase, partial [Bacteroidia bacterium]|nr:RluA family pseudouridine synthase [Bacteroidia bacterium]